MLSQLKTRLGKGQGVQQMYAPSVLEADAVNPPPGDSAAETVVIAKKHSAVFLDTVLTALGRHLKAAAVRPSCSSFMLKDELHNPKNPEYAANCDTESTKEALGAMLMNLRAAGVPVSLGEIRDAFISRLPDELKKEMILHGFDRLETCDAAGIYKAAYEEAPMIENALRATGAFTPCDTNVAGPPKMSREHRLAALGGGSRRGDDDSRRGNKRGSGSSLKEQFCLSHAAGALGLGARDCGSSCERCASHGKSLREFHKGLSGTDIPDKFPPTARKWVREIIDTLASPASSDVPSSAVVADLQSQIAALPVQFGSSPIVSPPTAAGGFTTSDNCCRNTVAALTSNTAPP